MTKSITIATLKVNDDIGHVLVGRTEKGICALYFGQNVTDLMHELQQDFPGSVICADEVALADEMSAVLAILEGVITPEDAALPLDISGTDFQMKVWNALCRIPYGETRTYQEVAVSIGQPTAARAVGTACGANKISLLVPCHRVLNADETIMNYRWGVQVKQALLKKEADQVWKHISDIANPSGRATLSYVLAA